MKKYFIGTLLSILVPVLMSGQTDPLVSNCSKSAGPNTSFLKDFPVKTRPCPKDVTPTELRYIYPYAMSKNMTYRFTLCNTDNTKAPLLIKIKDSDGKIQLTNFDVKSGKPYPNPNPYIDFVCQRAGSYTVLFDFKDFQQGSGVGIVSLVKSK